MTRTVTGWATLLRFLLRRERRALPWWLGGSAFLVAFQSVGSQNIYDTPEKLAQLQQTYGNQGLQIVGVSVDDPVEKLGPFASEFKMNYPVLVGLDREDLQDAYGPMWGIPTTFVISRDGRICRKHSGLIGKDRYERDIKALL